MQSILRLPAVRARVAMSRSTIYQRVREGTFPPPVNLGKRAVGWLVSDVDTWLAAQIERSRKSA
jgi:prophage regulatory protein